VIDLRTVRQIFPIGAGRQTGRPVGTGEPLGSRARLRPSAAADPAVLQVVADLAGLYAYPDQPWVRANMVASVDGAASADGRSGGLSGAADRLLFSVLRSLADVILVGAGTARAERYGQVRAASVWSRLREGRPAAPPIAVVTRRLDLDLGGPLLTGRPGLARTIVITTGAAPAERRAMAARSADVVIAGERDVTAAAAVAALAAAGHHRILLEGGPTLLGQMVAENLLDELCLTLSPVLEGGRAPRIVGETAPSGLPGSAGLMLASVLEDGGYLLLRYLRSATQLT
jgi:riboflavin biosynthesis pyrimidine reductase